MLTNIKSLCDYRRSYLWRLPSKIDVSRRFVVITDDAVSQFSLNGHGQSLMALFVIVLIGWSVFATGGYLVAKDQLERKKIRLAETTYLADQLHDNLSIFRRDLTRLSSLEKQKVDEYKSFVVGQYQNMDVSANDKVIRSTLLERITFLENKLNHSEKHKSALISAINETTDGKIQEINSVIKKTGVKVGHILKNPPLKEIKVRYGNAGTDDLTGKGGPYQPGYDETLLQEYDKELLDKIAYLKDLQGAYEAIPLGKPMKKYRITSVFGSRVDPFTHKIATHDGLDLAWKKGAAVIATADGEVVYARKRGSYGNVITIKHGHGFTTTYAHLSKTLKVKRGDKVKRGQLIGYQGNTGRSTGDHLHYEVRFNGKMLNPKNFLEAEYGIL